MKIGIIGSGNVGGTLGKRWAKNGHTVTFSSRNPDSDEMRKLIADSGASAKSASVKEAVEQSDIILLATPWPATKDAVANAGSLSGRILIDATNPLLPDLSGLEIGNTTSGAELVAQWAPGAKVVKAFNTVGYNIMADPNLNGQAALLYYCGDQTESKEVVNNLAKELGFDPQDAGPLKQARLLEPFALLWISLAFTEGHGREFAFRTINRK